MWIPQRISLMQPTFPALINCCLLIELGLCQHLRFEWWSWTSRSDLIAPTLRYTQKKSTGSSRVIVHHCKHTVAWWRNWTFVHQLKDRSQQSVEVKYVDRDQSPSSVLWDQLLLEPLPDIYACVQGFGSCPLAYKCLNSPLFSVLSGIKNNNWSSFWTASINDLPGVGLGQIPMTTSYNNRRNMWTWNREVAVELPVIGMLVILLTTCLSLVTHGAGGVVRVKVVRP